MILVTRLCNVRSWWWFCSGGRVHWAHSPLFFLRPSPLLLHLPLAAKFVFLFLFPDYRRRQLAAWMGSRPPSYGCQPPRQALLRRGWGGSINRQQIGGCRVQLLQIDGRQLVGTTPPVTSAENIVSENIVVLSARTLVYSRVYDWTHNLSDPPLG